MDIYDDGGSDTQASTQGDTSSFSQGGGDIFSSVINGAFNIWGQNQANKQNREMALDNRNWQERMSNTAHQREVADLQAAGLNPMLGIMKGSAGSNTPQPTVPHMESITKNFTASAAQAALIRAQVEKLDAESNKDNTQAAVNEAQRDFVEQETTTSGFRGANLNAQTGHIGWLWQLTKAEIEKTLQGTNTSAADEKRILAEAMKILEETKNVPQMGKLLAAETNNTAAQAALHNLDIPRARNIAESQKSWVKREMSPYLPEASALGTAGAVATVLRRPTQITNIRK